MDSGRWQKIQSFFHEAADLPETEQRTFLETQCGNDLALLEDVLALLREDARGNSLLDGNVAQVAHQILGDPASAPPAFHAFGPYRILKTLGEGGMGIVYLAEREDLGSKVAIKVLRDAWLSPARRDRFAIEQRTLAQLNHPSIARLYDANTWPDGTPFFVMEYVEGLPLTDYCMQHNSSIQERLRLFRAVCDAVLYAHQHGVIHRDLKPSNILVKDDGTLRLLDFGIAKHLEHLGQSVEQTVTGLRLMTPAYAAPEQIRGEQVGIQTDVYSLGVILYQLLAGRLPFDLANRTPAQAEKILTEQAPEKPSSVAGKATGLPGRDAHAVSIGKTAWADLDVLCLTAMHKDTQRRYGWVESLMRDVDHYLCGEPLEARPDSLPYRVGKFVRRNPRAVAATLLGCVAVVALAALEAKLGLATKVLSPRAGVAQQRITALAVLPLGNSSGDPGQDYLADGMTEGLITELSQIRALKVISRNTVMRYKGTNETPPQIARELNVRGVVEGSVVRFGDRMRLTVRLIDAARDAPLWSESYDRDMKDVLNLQRELARQLLRETNVPIRSSEEKQLDHSENVLPQAHDLYLRGRFFWNQRTRAALFKAVDYFQQAGDADPNYPQAYAGLADAYVELVGFGQMVPAEGIPKAKAAAMKAIALDESLAEAHTALAYGNGVNWDWGGAHKEFQRALQLNPGYVTAVYQYGFFLSTMGKHREAIALARQALELDPLSPIVLYRAGRVYFQARDYEKAIEQFRRILELNPNDPLGLYGLGLVYKAQGKYDLAISYLEKQNLQQGFDLAAAYAAAGKKAESRRKLADEMERLRKENSYIRPGWVAEVYVNLGEKDEAIRWLEQAYRDRDIWLALLKVWPPFDPLRSDPRFQALVRRMNFPP
jgi:serine/threonine-protein kinase